MKRLGPSTYDGIKGFGKVALINVEPDFSAGYAMQAVNNNGVCFGFCTGQGNNPSLLKASVATSGYADAAGFANTYAGFTQTLSHLRDLYAPNVLLGWDISGFATGIDIGGDTNETTNMVALGQQVGVFVGQTGAHDVLFNSPLDRDAGQYKVQFGQNRWWDRLNVAAPNFQRWEHYLRATGAADGNKSILLWQVPIGNQYFATENNSNGHFQDNRVEYLFGHVPELIQSGVIGAMFGAGNSGDTVESDATGDGITNPALICSTDGVSSGQICNNHTSTVADDDGGYIRVQGQAYYQNPIALGGTLPAMTPIPTATVASATGTPAPTAIATPASGQTFSSSAVVSAGSVLPGATLSITASLTSSTNAAWLVDLEVYTTAGVKVFQQAWDNQVFSAGVARQYTSTWQVPTSAPSGGYTVTVGGFKPGWTGLAYWNGAAAAFSVDPSATSTPRSTPTSTPTPKPTSTPTPTRTSTPKPTSTSVPAATATQPPATPTLQPSYTSSAAVSPSSAQRGSPVSITASLNSSTPSNALIDLEVYDALGVKVFQQAWDTQPFTARQTHTYPATWSIPASARTGSYSVKIGIFAPGWTALLQWNDAASSFTIN